MKIDEIVIEGNAKTKDYIIFRELTFAKDDTIKNTELPALLEQSRLNLLNTGLFNFVTLSSGLTDSLSQQTTIIIRVQERWYIWPKPVLEITDRNFNAWWSGRDFSRVNYGMGVNWNNFTGRMDMLSLMLQSGKSFNLSFAYFNPFLVKRKKAGAGLVFSYTKNKEVGAITMNDKLIYLSGDVNLIKELRGGLNLEYKNTLFNTQLLEITFYNVAFHDSLISANPDFSYIGERELHFLQLYYKLKIDHRDIHYYPLKGWYADVEMSKYGFGFQFEKPVSVAWLKTTSRLFIPLSNRWYSGASVMAKISSAAIQPYYFMQGLGYGREFVRGYQYNVVDGKHFFVTKATIKYALIPEKEASLKQLNIPKFTRFHYAAYLTVFADAGYVWNSGNEISLHNKLPNSWLASVGAGIDFVTYYDKVVRLEYTLNKSNKGGFFIHFISGI